MTEMLMDVARKIKSLPKIHLLLATPCYGGQCHVGFVNSLISTINVLQQVDIEVEYCLLGGESLITRARNSLIAKFMSKPFTHIIFLDADVSWEAVNILRLLASGLEVCGGIYCKKAINWDRVLAGETDPERVSDLNVNRLDGRCAVGEFLPVRHLATGFMCIRKSVIDTLILKHPETKYSNNVSGYADAHDWFYNLFHAGIVDSEYLSEDYWFCNLVRDAGIEIWADTECPLGHTGNMTFRANLKKQYVDDGLGADERMISLKKR